MTILPPDPDLAALRVTLARLRVERNWTFDELARRSGLARRTLIDLEHGRTTGSVTTWHTLAHAFGVPSTSSSDPSAQTTPHPARRNSEPPTRPLRHPCTTPPEQATRHRAQVRPVARTFPGIAPSAGHHEEPSRHSGAPPGTFTAMCPNSAFAPCHWDGSPRATRPRRPLRVAATSPSRLLRTGQSSRCRTCGNRIDFYQRTDQRPIALHPAELAAAHVPASCRWHLSCGIAHPHGDGSACCRIPHAVLCPSRTPTVRLTAHVEEMRRQLGVRSRRLIDSGAFVPSTPPAPGSASGSARQARPVVQLLLGRYLADRPVEDIRCVAQTRHRRRCPLPVLAPGTPKGIWKLLPAGPQRGQLTLPTGPMAVSDLSRLPYGEQLRWRTHHCPAHAAAPNAADLALAGWQVFDPLLHAAHIRTRLPHAPGDQA